MNINFQFIKTPEGKDAFGVQVLGDPIFRFQTPPLDTREMLRQVKRQQPQAFRDVHYEIVTPEGPALDLSHIEAADKQ